MSKSSASGRRAAAIAITLALAVLSACSGGSQTAGEGRSPEDVVRAYLAALQSGNYSAAYDHLMPHMTRDQGNIAWVAEQTAIMNLADVKIDSFEVFPARPDGDKAIVPNLLKSKDKYINQTGANEYELYTLVRSAGGSWKIQQQQLVESDAVQNWFPERVREGH
jgi:hypothetical protein